MPERCRRTGVAVVLAEQVDRFHGDHADCFGDLVEPASASVFAVAVEDGEEVGAGSVQPLVWVEALVGNCYSKNLIIRFRMSKSVRGHLPPKR